MVQTDSLHENRSDSVAKTYSSSQNQLHWMNRQVFSLERELLLNNINHIHSMPKQMNNWIKVILTAVACIIPGIGQLIGIILGLFYVSSDTNADKRTFGAALLTVSLMVFFIMSIFWFVIFVALGPLLY